MTGSLNSSELSPFYKQKVVTLTWSHRASLAIRGVIRSGRGIHRLVSLFGTVRQLVKESDRRLLGLPDSDDEDDEDPEASQPPQDPQEVAQRYVFNRWQSCSSSHVPQLRLCRRDRDWRSYQALVKLVPGLKQRVSDPNEVARSLYYTNVSRTLGAKPDRN